MSNDPEKNETYLELTVDVVSAYVARNPVPAAELPSLISSVSNAMSGLGQPIVTSESMTPAVNPKRSVHDDHIVCLEDGRKFKSIKRHLANSHNLTPDEYRAKWGLPFDYPMVAPDYAAERSTLAKKLGLGRANAGKKRKSPL